MNERAAELIRSLDLAEHPEGGFFREAFRSSRRVVDPEDRRERDALTTIYYLLPKDHHSRWHVLGSDEIWHFYEGAPLELLIAEPERLALSRTVLGPATDGRRPVHGVPAGHWQAARSTGDYTLVGCSMGPGFDFANFKLLKDDADTARRFRETLPDVAGLI
jgi:predicted cupin superfamily sugar epimerase